MKVNISFELDVTGMDEDHIHDYIADLTYEMRVSRMLVNESWRCEYDTSLQVKGK